MKDHKKNFREIQERAYREAEEKKERLEKEKLEKREPAENIKKKEKGKETERENIEKENNQNILSALSGTAMSTPTPQDFYAMQEQLAQMQQMFTQFTHNASQQSNTNTRPDFDIIKTFLKLPTSFHTEHNPQKVKLLFDGSNYQHWEREVNRTLSYVFDTETKFVENKANFITQGKREKGAIAVLLRGTVDESLLSIVQENVPSKSSSC
jgi:hypothetical protein